MGALSLPKGLTLEPLPEFVRASFQAMASPCEFLIETRDLKLAQTIAVQGYQEVRRIEQKFSRYNPTSLCSALNGANGKRVAIDEECHRLLSFGDTCYQLSDGLFDLTSGILRQAWQFDGRDRVPQQAQIAKLLPRIGWHKVSFDENSLRMDAGMELDFGGIGKEYAVSRVAELSLSLSPTTSVLVNLGGDIQITRARAKGQSWQIGIERPSDQQAGRILSLKEGALATSGDSKRYLLKDGVRYSHILNPKTGWPIQGAPASITTIAPFCIQAGCLATLALLQGANAESFLKEQEVTFWSEWS